MKKFIVALFIFMKSLILYVIGVIDVTIKYHSIMNKFNKETKRIIKNANNR